MGDIRPELQLEEPDNGGLEPFQELERRISDLVEQVRDARRARAEAELEVNRLRDQVRERDTQIVALKDALGNDSMRIAFRKRVEALIRRVDELDREG